MDMNRKSKEEYYLDIAKAVCARSTCLRRQYGAVIVNHDEIVSTGYNGSPRGESNCCDTGKCYRILHNVPHGSDYAINCNAVHAEMNAIISAKRADMIGATLYLYGNENGEPIKDTHPCRICERLIKNSGIEKVVVNK